MRVVSFASASALEHVSLWLMLTVWEQAVLATGGSISCFHILSIKERVALAGFGGASPVLSFDQSQPVGHDSGGLLGELSGLCTIVQMRSDVGLWLL
eukprot:331825-Pelagomonas_calceolata.AAC.1